MSKSTKWRKLLTVALAVVMVFSLAACSTDGNVASNNTEDNSDQPQKIRIGYMNVMDDAQAILAWRAGIYEKYGLEAEMQVFTSGTDLIKQIVGGNLDAGVLGFTNALSWIDKGSDLKIVGGAQRGYHAMLVGDESGIDGLADLKGKSIASQKQGSTADVVLNGVVFEQGGFTREEVTIQGVSPAVAIQSLAAGTVDAAFVFEPYSTVAKLSYPVKEIYEIGQEWPFPCMVVITSGDVAANKKDLMNKLLDAQKEAIEMLENDPAKAAEYITEDFIPEGEITKLDGTKVPAEEVITAAIESQEFNWALSEQDITRMDEVAQMMVDQGIVENKVDVHAALDLTWQKQYE
jgi:NitT/TauT family transport system substrate-binding protein